VEKYEAWSTVWCGDVCGLRAVGV